MYNFSNPSGKCVNVRLMTETWGAQGRRHARPLNPRLSFPDWETTLTLISSYLKTYLSLKQKKISFVWNFFGSSGYFWDYIVGPVGGKITQLSSLSCLGEWCHSLFCLMKSDKRRSTHISPSEREKGCYWSTRNLLWDWSREVIKLSTTHTF